MQMPEPSVEHQFLMQLVGEWEFERECVMGPDQPPQKSIGKQSIRALGSLWTWQAFKKKVALREPLKMG